MTAETVYIEVRPDDTFRAFSYIWAGKDPIKVGDKVVCPATDFRGDIPGTILSVSTIPPELPEHVTMKTIQTKES